MNPFTIESIEEWNKLSGRLHEKEYKPWQYQYSWNSPEGFHAWFWKSGKDDIEIITHSEEVHSAIIKFNNS